MGALIRLRTHTAIEFPPGGRDLLKNWKDGRYLEIFSGFMTFCFQIATDSDCRTRSGEGIMEGGGRRGRRQGDKEGGRKGDKEPWRRFVTCSWAVAFGRGLHVIKHRASRL